MTKEITSQEDYLALLAQIDGLFEDYDANKNQIDYWHPCLKGMKNTQLTLLHLINP